MTKMMASLPNLPVSFSEDMFLEKESVPERSEDITEKGGPGSGNFGHSGLTGVHGGSSPTKNVSIAETSAFETWFGDSKVVDENGNPKIVYHGTDANFQEFTKNRGLTGYHFGTTEQADFRIGGTMPPYYENANIMPVYLSIQNPIELNDHDWDTMEHLMDALSKRGIQVPQKMAKVAEMYSELKEPGLFEDREKHKEYWEKYQNYRKQFRDFFSETLISHGYDGAYYENNVEGTGTSWIALFPEQIKSAFNEGSFNPDNSNIMKEVSQKGGPGSGNFGHSGLAGVHGGSSPTKTADFSKGGLSERVEQAFEENAGVYKGQTGNFDYIKDPTERDARGFITPTGNAYGSSKHTIVWNADHTNIARRVLKEAGEPDEYGSVNKLLEAGFVRFDRNNVELVLPASKKAIEVVKDILYKYDDGNFAIEFRNMGSGVNRRHTYSLELALWYLDHNNIEKEAPPMLRFKGGPGSGNHGHGGLPGVHGGSSPTKNGGEWPFAVPYRDGSVKITNMSAVKGKNRLDYKPVPESHEKAAKEFLDELPFNPGGIVDEVCIIDNGADLKKHYNAGRIKYIRTASYAKNSPSIIGGFDVANKTLYLVSDRTNRASFGKLSKYGFRRAMGLAITTNPDFKNVVMSWAKNKRDNPYYAKVPNIGEDTSRAYGKEDYWDYKNSFAKFFANYLSFRAGDYGATGYDKFMSNDEQSIRDMDAIFSHRKTTKGGPGSGNFGHGGLTGVHGGSSPTKNVIPNLPRDFLINYDVSGQKRIHKQLEYEYGQNKKPSISDRLPANFQGERCIVTPEGKVIYSNAGKFRATHTQIFAYLAVSGYEDLDEDQMKTARRSFEKDSLENEELEGYFFDKGYASVTFYDVVPDGYIPPEPRNISVKCGLSPNYKTARFLRGFSDMNFQSGATGGLGSMMVFFRDHTHVNIDDFNNLDSLKGFRQFYSETSYEPVYKEKKEDDFKGQLRTIINNRLEEKIAEKGGPGSGNYGHGGLPGVHGGSSPKSPLDLPYGGIPSVGGYDSETEYEVGHQRFCEAAHCILGSLGKIKNGNPKSIEKGHILEELDIMRDAIKEYSRDIYTNNLDPERYSEIKDAGGSLLETIKDMRSRLGEPSDEIEKIAESTYYVLAVFARTSRINASLARYEMINAFKDGHLRGVFAEFEKEIEDFFLDTRFKGYMKAIVTDKLIEWQEKGGPGSGNHGHAGLAGVHGGSSPTKNSGQVGTTLAESDKYWKGTKVDKIRQQFLSVAGKRDVVRDEIQEKRAELQKEIFKKLDSGYEDELSRELYEEYTKTLSLSEMATKDDFATLVEIASVDDPLDTSLEIWAVNKIGGFESNSEREWTRKHFEKKFNEPLWEFLQIVPKGLVRDGTLMPIETHLGIGHKGTFYSPNDEAIVVDPALPSFSNSDIVHEFAHWLESHTSITEGITGRTHMQVKAKEFFDRRTGGEGQKYVDIFDAICYPDRFHSPYVGRVYYGEEYYTEVVSMGFQYLYADPVDFARTDPDYFNFTLSLLLGE